jgi:hypothetical protein
MLHREADESGKVDWRQFSGLEQHGDYHTEIPDDECLALARITKEYENAFLTHEIRFLEFINDFFVLHHLRHVQKMYNDRMRWFAKGVKITVMVFYDGQLDEHQIQKF